MHQQPPPTVAATRHALMRAISRCPPPPSPSHAPPLPPACRRFILGLGVAIGFAAAVPQLGATRGYIRAEYSVKLPAIIAIFVISGLGLKTKALAHAAADLKLHLLIQGLSLGLLPLLGYAVARGLRASGFNPHLADGLVVMACMPTTVSTNVVYTQKVRRRRESAWRSSQ